MTSDCIGDMDFGRVVLIYNLGTFQKSGIATTSTISPIFNNSGTVNVQNGTLSLTGGGTDSGIFNVSSGATLQLDRKRVVEGTSVDLGCRRIIQDKTRRNAG